MRDCKNFEVTIDAAGTVKRTGAYAQAPLRNLLQSQADLKRQGNALLAAAADENRPLSKGEAATFDACTRELAQLDQALVGAHADQDIERHMPTFTPGDSASASAAGIVRSGGRRYADLFPGVAREMNGFKSADEFLATLHSGLADARLSPAYAPHGLMATATTTVPSDGGFSVPTEVFSQWLDHSLESEIVRSRADVRAMVSSDAVAPGWDDGDHSASLYGGFTGQWVPEAGDITPATPKMRLIHLHARKLAILASVSNELIADGVNFENQLGVAITKALGFFLDTAFLNGAGAAAPLGVINSSATISVAKETNQTAATINYTNVAKMFARLMPASIPNAIWVCNSTAIPQLLQLSIPIGVGGSQIPVLNESNGVWRMLTLPVIFTEKTPALGTKGDIGLYDFAQYAIGLRADFTLAKSQHVGFTTDTTYYRGIIRVDGQPKLTKPITPVHGDTLSPFVVLDNR